MSLFDKHRVKRWRRDVWRIYEQQGFKPAEILAAMVLAAVASFGTDVSALSEITGHSTAYVTKVLRRLRKQRVLSGQTLRTPGMSDDANGHFGAVLDAGVAAGIFSRFVDPKRSKAQQARKPETRTRGPRRKRETPTAGAVFTPKVQKSNPLYGLPEWEKQAK